VDSAPEESLALRIRRRLAAAGAAAARAQAAVLLTALYWLVIGPAAAAARLLGADPLARRRPAATGWVPRPPRGARASLEGQG
jgi:hypothetical protein